MTDNHAAEVELRQTDLHSKGQEVNYILQEHILPNVNTQEGVEPEHEEAFSSSMNEYNHELRKIKAVKRKLAASNRRIVKERRTVVKELGKA